MKHRHHSVVGVAFAYTQGLGILLQVNVGQAFVEQQREDVLLVVGGVDLPTQKLGRAPEQVFEFLFAELGGLVFLVLNHSYGSCLIADEQAGSGRRGVYSCLLKA